MRRSLGVISLFICLGSSFCALAQQPAALAGASDLDNCKAGQGDACVTYGKAFAATCQNGGTDLQKLECMRKASCYENRGVQLKSSYPSPYTTDSCDAKLTAGSGDDISGVYIPTTSFHWSDDVHAGDCTQSDGTMTIKADGSISWSAIVVTSHTTFGDIWHGKFAFLDKDGVGVGNFIEFDSPKMGVPLNKEHWDWTGTFDKSLFPKIAAMKEYPNC